jgi:hypothetical protein
MIRQNRNRLLIYRTDQMAISSDPASVTEITSEVEADYNFCVLILAFHVIIFPSVQVAAAIPVWEWVAFSSANRIAVNAVVIAENRWSCRRRHRQECSNETTNPYQW